MTSNSSNDPVNPSRRNLLASGASALGATLLPAGLVNAQMPDASTTASPISPDSPPAGYNILFVLVDQEHFFPKWPMPVPAREAIKKKAITFTNHQAASMQCSSARSVIYTGLHIQHSGIFDNLNFLWQPDLSYKVKTIGHRLSELGYHAAYQGKWHLSANMDVVKKAYDAPMATYRKIIQSYGFNDFLGVGDIVDEQQGGYTFDKLTVSSAIGWLRNEGQVLRDKKQPWYLAVNIVNPHDVTYVNSDLPGKPLQGAKHAMTILPVPTTELYQATWDNYPLPESRKQALDAPGRPKAHKLYQEIWNLLMGEWPNEDRRWRLLLDYYFNCMRDSDENVAAVMQGLKDSGMEDNTIVIFTADHGELGGTHQMRGKGTTAYKEQNHIPLMIIHPAYPGGKDCQAITSQIDLATTILAMTGKGQASIQKASEGLKGRDLTPLFKEPEKAKVDSARPAALFNFNMLMFTSWEWAQRTYSWLMAGKVSDPSAEQILRAHEPNFNNRVGIRSVWDGRYRFSRYFSPLHFNTPTTLEELMAKNDLELFDLHNDPDEMNNLAMDPQKNAALIMAMNQVMNQRIAEEVGIDDGRFLPIRNGKWYFPKADQR
ncbi:sulfatase-like hydrolase/transferase [Polynucleobacter asymbioticus]|uniref:sulfatase-like hydrolase/transferase n=1 Tax=Polynucleobacter asymbioticus TaxID=576611 RepID=UPI0008F8C374|nr:sulfatase-like hydrolase/transferase [Polynucleobacter asymbioticus]APC06600.1 arylsulfatase [Polynucleobacter asymbioticus]